MNEFVLFKLFPLFEEENGKILNLIWGFIAVECEQWFLKLWIGLIKFAITYITLWKKKLACTW